MNTLDVENYPGFGDGINGFDLMNIMRKQCKNLDKNGSSSLCQLIQEDVVEVKFNTLNHNVITRAESYYSKTVIIATGATAKTLNISDNDIFWNHGISACAVCDGELPIFRNKPVAVIGGGDIACEEALFVSRFTSKIYMLVRGPQMRASHRISIRLLQTTR